jgi:hypothetical protein
MTTHFAYFTTYFVLFPACGCASERWHRSRCPQLNTPATFPAALLSFLLQKRKQGGRVTVPTQTRPRRKQFSDVVAICGLHNAN